MQFTKDHPPGHIGVATSFLGRYREFDACLERTILPEGSRFQYYMGVDVCLAFNNMCKLTLSEPTNQWLWILGDDHLWSTDLLVNLLAREVDVVTPLCCRRLAPFFPILHGAKDSPNGFGVPSMDPWELLKGKSGLMEWDGTSGNAGMLIRREVLERMQDPWFENGKTRPGVGGSDLYFWHKLHELGIKPYLDLDNLIGHITHACVWPYRNAETGEWTYAIRTP